MQHGCSEEHAPVSTNATARLPRRNSGRYTGTALRRTRTTPAQQKQRTEVFGGDGFDAVFEDGDDARLEDGHDRDVGWQAAELSTEARDVNLGYRGRVVEHLCIIQDRRGRMHPRSTVARGVAEPDWQPAGAYTAIYACVLPSS